MSQPQDPRGLARREAADQSRPLKRPGERAEGQGSQTGAALAEREAESDYASLSASLHETWGNTLVQAALSGHREGPAEIIHGAMTLGASGVAVPESSGSLFSNHFVNDWIGEHGGAEEQAPVLRRADGESFQEDAAERLDRARARRGKPLPESVRRDMEAAFGGVDFSGVRIHTDATARDASRSIRAEAYTVGQDIYFDEVFDPASASGRHLLAHELTHVVQHQEGRLRAIGEGLKVSSPTDVVEQEAERVAHQVTAELGELDAASVEAPTLDTPESAPSDGPAPSQGEGVFRRRRSGPQRQDPRSLRMEAESRARDRRRQNRSQGPRRPDRDQRKLTPERHERFDAGLKELLESRGPELLAALGWGAPTEADAQAEKPRGEAGQQDQIARGYASWKRQYPVDGRASLEQHQQAGKDLVEFLEDLVEAYLSLSQETLGQVAHEDAWTQFTSALEGEDEDEGEQEQDSEQETPDHDGLQGHADANKGASPTAGRPKGDTPDSFDGGDDGQAALPGQLSGGAEEDAASPRIIDVRASVDCLVDEANRFAQDFLAEVDSEDVTEGTGHGGELADLQANTSAGGAVAEEGSEEVDGDRAMEVSGSGARLFSKPGSRNPANVVGNLPPGTALEAGSTQPGWTHVTVTEGPMTGQTGWIPSGDARDQGGEEDLLGTIDELLSQGQAGLRQVEQMVRDPRQAIHRLSGGQVPPAVTEALGEAFGWTDQGPRRGGPGGRGPNGGGPGGRGPSQGRPNQGGRRRR